MQVEMCTKNNNLKKEYICPEEISKKLDQSINKIIEKTGFTQCNIEKKTIFTNGGNYLGMLYEIDIKGNTKDGEKELNLFVKSIIPGENDLQILSMGDIYKTELFTYKELAKIFEELQEEAKVPIEGRFKMVKTYDESNEEMIIMENVSRKGFSTGHRMDVVSLEFAEMAIQELARLHSFAFVLQEKRPDFFERQITTRKTAFIIGEQFHGFFESMSKIALNNIDDDFKPGVEKFCKGISEAFQRHYNDETVIRFLCHGDYRPNNILKKIIEGEVTDVIVVDYQLLHYGCPVMDILYFIFSCTDKEFRGSHLSYLKDLYHKTMTKFLEYFEIDVNSYYPRNDFEKEFKNKLDYGLIYALTFLPFVFALEEDIPDITKGEMSSISFRVDEKYKGIIKGIVEDYIEWGVI